MSEEAQRANPILDADDQGGPESRQIGAVVLSTAESIALDETATRNEKHDGKVGGLARWDKHI